MKRLINKHEKGVALLMALGMLALLSILGICFATSMRLGEKGCQAFVWNIQTRYIAEGGIARAIADLKYNATQGAASKFIDDRNEGWFYKDGPGVDIKTAADPAYKYPGTTVSYMDNVCYAIFTGKNIRGTTKLKILDTASQININDWKNLDLPDILGFLGLPADAVTSFKAYILPTANKKPFTTKQDIELVPNIGPATYKIIKDYITTSSYKDPNNNDKAGINVNTASKNVLQAVFTKILGEEWKTGTKSDKLAAVITNPSSPALPVVFNSWAEFNSFIEARGTSKTGGYLTEGTGGDIEKIENGVNPNKGNSNNTKFIFNSGGTYEIECLAKVGVSHTEIGTLDASRDLVLSEKRIKTVVKIFDLWNQTTKENFQGDLWVDADWNNSVDATDSVDANNDGDYDDEPVYARVTWLDNCPVKSNDNWELEPNDDTNYNSGTHYFTIENSLKMGFWDNFKEDINYTLAQWYPMSGRFRIRTVDSQALYGWLRATCHPNRSDVWGYLKPGERYLPNIATVGGGLENFSILVLGRCPKNNLNVAQPADDKRTLRLVERWGWTDFFVRLNLWSYNAVFDTKMEDGDTPITVEHHTRLDIENRKRCYDVAAHLFLKRQSENVFVLQHYDITANNLDPFSGDLDKVIVASDKPSKIVELKNHEGVFTEPQYSALPADIKSKCQTIASFCTGYDFFDGMTEAEIRTYIGDLYDCYYYPDAFPEAFGLNVGGAPPAMWPTKEEGDFSEFPEELDLKVVVKSSGTNDTLAVTDYSDGSIITKNKTFAAWNSGPIALGALNYLFRAKWIRVIGNNGYYISPLIDQTIPQINLPNTYEWGTLYASVTIPSSSAADSEIVTISVRSDGEDDDAWENNVIDSSAIAHEYIEGPINEQGNQLIQYRVDFSTNDSDYSETPVVEDVWLTYLPKTRILYWKEN